MKPGLLSEPPDFLQYDPEEFEALENPEFTPPEGVSNDDLVLLLARKVFDNDAEAELLRNRAKELSEKAQRREKNTERLKQYMMKLMDKAGHQKLKDEEFTVSISEREGGLVVIDVEKLPLNFTRLKKEADKTAINKSFKSTGEIPDGCEVAEKTRFIQIRSK